MNDLRRLNTGYHYSQINLIGWCITSFNTHCILSATWDLVHKYWAKVAEKHCKSLQIKHEDASLIQNIWNVQRVAKKQNKTTPPQKKAQTEQKTENSIHSANKHPLNFQLYGRCSAAGTDLWPSRAERCCNSVTFTQQTVPACWKVRSGLYWH